MTNQPDFSMFVVNVSYDCSDSTLECVACRQVLTDFDTHDPTPFSDLVDLVLAHRCDPAAVIRAMNTAAAALEAAEARKARAEAEAAEAAALVAKIQALTGVQP